MKIPWYVPKWAEEIARGVGVALAGYAITAISTGGFPTTQQAWLSFAAGALTVAWAALRAALNKTPLTPDEPSV